MVDEQLLALGTNRRSKAFGGQRVGDDRPGGTGDPSRQPPAHFTRPPHLPAPRFRQRFVVAADQVRRDSPVGVTAAYIPSRSVTL
jgi:hypothetical protein